MVNVSDNFKLLATQSGRHIYCKIVAGEETFLDDRIIEFDFDDVIHPEYITIGTTCSNRFSFTVRYSDELEVRDEVRPYISFDNKEWCPLGVFYVSRRYVRGNYASITCYDRMYYLTEEYVPTIDVPTTAGVLFHDVCTQHNIPYVEINMQYRIRKLPKGYTVREVLGFIASMAGTNIKFNREGILEIRRLDNEDKNIIVDSGNCMDYRCNLNVSQITGVRFNKGDEDELYGVDSELSCIEVFNPIIEPDVARSAYYSIIVYPFYGAEIKMQGLPYIESGDRVILQNVNDETGTRSLYRMWASEIDYHYNGGLTATFYCKNKTNTDYTVHEEDLRTAINDIRSTLGNIYLKVTNGENINFDSSYVTVASFEFETLAKETFAQVDLNFTVYTEADATLSVRVYVNGEEMSRKAVHKTTGGKRDLVHYYYLAENLAKGKNTIALKLSSLGSSAQILANQLIATMIGRGMAGGDGGDIRDRLSYYDVIPAVEFVKPRITISDYVASASANTEVQT